MVKTRRKSQKGGGWSWSLNSLGTGWTEFTNSLMSQNNSANVPNNFLPNVNANANPNANANANPNVQLMKAGKRKRKQGTVKHGGNVAKHGGNVVKHGGNVVAQAVVPLSLFAMNNALGTCKRRRRR
jgi:hypothetical protein